MSDNTGKTTDKTVDVDEARATVKTKTTKKVVIKFVKGDVPYVKGDVAGFDKKTAQKYIDDGVAVKK